MGKRFYGRLVVVLSKLVFSSDNRLFKLLSGLVLVAVVVALFVWLFMNYNIVESLMNSFGLLGLFIASIVANATILFPVPLDLFIIGLGVIARSQELGIFQPLIFGIVAGGGAAIGEMTAYVLGLFGIKSIERLQHHQFKKMNDIRLKLKNYGMLFVFLGALTPFPFDLIGIAAGLIKYDIRKFFVSALAGKLARYILLGYAAYLSIEALTRFFVG